MQQRYIILGIGIIVMSIILYPYLKFRNINITEGFTNNRKRSKKEMREKSKVSKNIRIAINKWVAELFPKLIGNVKLFKFW